MSHGEHTPEFRYHHTNTQAPPNEQAGTAVSEQPLATPTIGSLLNKQGKLKNVECKPEQLESEVRAPTEWQRTSGYSDGVSQHLPDRFSSDCHCLRRLYEEVV